MKNKNTILWMYFLAIGGVAFAQFDYYDPYSNSNIDYFPANPINTSPSRTSGSSGTSGGSSGKSNISSPTKTESPITTSTPCANRPKQNPQNTRSVEIRDLNGKVFYLSPPKEELTEMRTYPETSQKIFKMIMDEMGMQKDEMEIGLITVDNHCYPKYGYIQNSPPPPAPAAPSPSPPPAPSLPPPPSPSTTNKSAIITNTKFGYSAKHPSHWRMTDPTGDGSNIFFDYGTDLFSIPDMSTATSISLTPIGPHSVFTSKNLEQVAKTNVEMIEANKFGDQDLKIRVKNTKIAKIKAKQINYLNSYVYEKKLEMVQYLFVKDGFVWTIAGPIKELGLKQILKSFKFIPKK